jgi:hypothetical protein
MDLNYNKMIVSLIKIIAQVNNLKALINKTYKVWDLKIIVDYFRQIQIVIYKVTQCNYNIGRFKCLNAAIENFIDRQTKDNSNKY